MASARRPKTPRQRAKEHRERMKRKGLRLIQMWVPDTRTPEFAAEARRQSLAVAQSEGEEEDIAFVESISELLEDTVEDE